VRLDEGGDIAIHIDSGRLVEFHLKDHPHLDYGYAVTSHSSQGQTADRVLIHADTEESAQLVNIRMAYVAVSRGRYDAQIYTNDKSELAQQLNRDISHHTAIAAMQEHPMDLGERIGASSMIAEKNHSATALGQSTSAGHEQAVGE